MRLPLKNFVGLLRYSVVFQALYFLSIPIILKSYEANAYGIFSVVFAVSTVIGSLGSLRLERAIVVEKELYTGSIIIRCAKSTIAASVIVFMITWVVLPSIGEASNSIWMYASVSAVYCIFTSLVQVLSHLAIKQEVVMLTGRSDVIYAMLLVIGLYFFSVENLDPALQLFLVFLVARGLSLAPYLKLELAKYFNITAHLNFNDLKRYYTVVITSFLASTQFRGIFFLTSIYYGNAVTGNLSMAHRIMYAPVNLVGGSLRRAFFLEFTRSEEDGSELPDYIDKIWRIGVVISALIFPFFILFTHFSQAILPSDWEKLPYYGLAMYPAVSIVILLTWLDRLFDVNKKQKLALVYEVVYTCFLYAALFTAVYLKLNSIYVLLVYSIVTTVYNMVWAKKCLLLIGVPSRLLRSIVYMHSAMILVVWVYLVCLGLFNYVDG